MKELKIKIKDLDQIKLKLIEAGAKLLSESTEKYTYFNQPKDKVLKITKKPKGTYKTVIEKVGDKFEIVENKKLDNPELTGENLASKFDIKKSLVNHREFYELNNENISINIIENIGEFIIITAENPSVDEAQKWLGTNNLEIIKDSFDNL